MDAGIKHIVAELDKSLDASGAVWCYMYVGPLARKRAVCAPDASVFLAFHPRHSIYNLTTRSKCIGGWGIRYKLSIS